jgi:hypothetical protein
VLPSGFEPVIGTIEQPLTQELDDAATDIHQYNIYGLRRYCEAVPQFAEHTFDEWMLRCGGLFWDKVTEKQEECNTHSHFFVHLQFSFGSDCVGCIGATAVSTER